MKLSTGAGFACSTRSEPNTWGADWATRVADFNGDTVADIATFINCTTIFYTE